MKIRNRIIPIFSIIFLSTYIIPYSASTKANATGVVCPIRSKVLSFYKQMFNEVVVIQGEADAGFMIEILSTKSGSRWAFLVSKKDENNIYLSCVISAGKNLKIIKKE